MTGIALPTDGELRRTCEATREAFSRCQRKQMLESEFWVAVSRALVQPRGPDDLRAQFIAQDGQVIWKDVRVPHEEGVRTGDLDDIKSALMLARDRMVSGAPEMYVVLRVS